MTPNDGLDRRLSAWLDEEAAPRAPEDLHMRFAGGVAHGRQRPGWATTERWISMETRAQLGALPRTAIVLVILGLLMAVAAGAIVVGSGADTQASNGRIAFVHQGDIYTAQPDGSERRVLVEAEGRQAGPSWSPDGTRLAYWSSAAGRWQLMVVDADGSGPVTVASEVLETTGWQTADWSPDGSRLAFSARTARAGQEPCVGESAVLGDFCSSRIFLAASDGSTGGQQVGDPNMDARTAAWSPDGSIIAFSGGHAEDGIGLYLMAPDGSDIRQLGGVTGYGWGLLRLGWSPDGSSIVGTAGKPQWNIWVVETDGSGASNVSAASVDQEIVADELFPAYAPDGTIGWGRGGDAPLCNCLVLLEEGGEPVELPDFDGTPLWSPDGQLIATTAGSTDVTIIDREGAIVATIDAVPGGEFGTAPSWQRLAP